MTIRRIPRVPRSDKLIRTWDDGDWSYDIYQRPNGDYTIVGVSDDDWAMVTRSNIKAALKACKAPMPDWLLNKETP